MSYYIDPNDPMLLAEPEADTDSDSEISEYGDAVDDTVPGFANDDSAREPSSLKLSHNTLNYDMRQKSWRPSGKSLYKGNAPMYKSSKSWIPKNQSLWASTFMPELKQSTDSDSNQILPNPAEERQLSTVQHAAPPTFNQVQIVPSAAPLLKQVATAPIGSNSRPQTQIQSQTQSMPTGPKVFANPRDQRLSQLLDYVAQEVQNGRV